MTESPPGRARVEASKLGRADSCALRRRLATALLATTTALSGAAIGGTVVEEAAPSPGCGQPPPAAPEAIEIDGENRPLILAIPEFTDGRTPQPLVIAFHGRTNDNAQVRAYYGLERSLEQQALVAYPSARRQADGNFAWTVRRTGGSGEADLAVFDTLLREIGRRYCIDLERIYLVGHSLGASFANTVACARAAQVRAVASLGGGIWTRRCDAGVAAMVMHNPHDRLVPIDHGRSARDVFLAADGLLDAPQSEMAESALKCRRYGDATEPNPVLWCPHQWDRKANGKYYPHNWPAATAKEIARFLASLP